MNPNYLDFEQPIADLDSKIDELRHLSTESGINIAEEVARLQAKSKTLTEKIFLISRFGKSTTCKTSKASLHLRLCAQLDRWI